VIEGIPFVGRDRGFGWPERRKTSMTELRQKMIADMTSAGLALSTKEVYLRGVRSLAAFYRRSPDQLSEAEVRSYLLHLRDQRGVARGTYTPHHGGIRFFFAHTLDREWSLFSKKESVRPSASVYPMCHRTRKLAQSSAA
jgi:hypothetical protein